MARFLAIHSVPPTVLATPWTPEQIKANVGLMTPQTYCVRTLLASGAGKLACEWEAPSEQSILEIIAKMQMPVDGVYAAVAIEWAEVAKQMGLVLGPA